LAKSEVFLQHAKLEKESRFIDASKLTGDDEIAEHMNRLVWITGSLSPGEGREPLEKKFIFSCVVLRRGTLYT
jgi:hypothetical protein